MMFDTVANVEPCLVGGCNASHGAYVPVAVHYSSMGIVLVLLSESHVCEWRSVFDAIWSYV